MAGISVKLTADVGGFKKGINEATAAVKTLDAQLETNEKQLKLNGDAELYMKNKSALLEKQLEEQRKVVVNTKNALDAMKKNGVSPASAEFQKMEQNLAKAQSKMVDIQTNLKEVQSGASGAKDETKEMNTELKKIGTGVAFQNITSGLKEVTDKLESGAKAAINFGKKIARSAMDSTEWADDVMTRAVQNGVDAETIQRMDNVAKYIDTDVDTIIAAKTRLAKNKDSLGDLLGIESPESVEDAFWRAGEAIMAMTDEFEKEEAAQKIFGKGWKELIPLFTAGQEEYQQLLAEQNVLSNEQVQKLGEADDQFKKIQQEAELLKNQFWAENSQTIIDLLQWLVDNKDGVVAAITVIGGAFAALKIAEFATNLTKVVDGFKMIKGMGGGGSGTGVGTGGTGGSPTVSPTTGAAAGGGTKWSLWTAAQGLLADAGTSLTGVLGGSALSALLFYGIAKGATAGNISIDMVDNPYRYNNVDNAEIIQTAVRGILGTNANSQDQAKWQLGWMAANLGTKNFFDTFNYTDANRGESNYLIDILGKQGTNQQKAAIWYMWQSAYGNPSDRYNVRGREAWDQLTSEQQRALQYGQEQYAALEQLGQLDLGSWIADMKQFFSGSGMFDENGKWWIPSEYEKSQQDQAAQIASAAAAMDTLPQEVAAAVENANITVVVPVSSENANGLPYVPSDGWLSILHQGERVLTARENRNYTANSNLYIENMHMGGGMDAQALAAAMAAQNRRISAGFGS